MTEREKEVYVVDPRVARALEQRGGKGFQNLLLELAGYQELDDSTKTGLFWQLIGWLAAEAGRAAARPWQFLTVVLLFSNFITVAWIWNFLVILLLSGALP